MSELAPNSVAVKILGQEYKVKCPSEKIVELQESAIYLNNLMLEIRENTPVPSADRIAVIAALNVAHDMLVLKKQKHAYIDLLSKRIQELQQKIEQALAPEVA